MVKQIPCSWCGGMFTPKEDGLKFCCEMCLMCAVDEAERNPYDPEE